MNAFNVRKVVNPGVDIKTFPELFEFSPRNDFCLGIGLHQHQGQEWDEPMAQQMKAYMSHAKVVAVGECGLDFFYNNSPPEKQIFAFKEHLKIARQFDK